jgi:hypothetical protein
MKWWHTELPGPPYRNKLLESPGYPALMWTLLSLTKRQLSCQWKCPQRSLFAGGLQAECMSPELPLSIERTIDLVHCTVQHVDHITLKKTPTKPLWELQGSVTAMCKQHCLSVEVTPCSVMALNSHGFITEIAFYLIQQPPFKMKGNP